MENIRAKDPIRNGLIERVEPSGVERLATNPYDLPKRMLATHPGSSSYSRRPQRKSISAPDLTFRTGAGDEMLLLEGGREWGYSTITDQLNVVTYHLANLDSAKAKMRIFPRQLNISEEPSYVSVEPSAADDKRTFSPRVVFPEFVRA